MIRKWLVTIIAVSAIALFMPMDANAQLGKGKGKGGGGKTTGGSSGGSKSGGSKSGGSKSGGAKTSGGKSSPPTTSGGSSGSKSTGASKGRTTSGSGRTTGGTSGGTTTRPPTGSRSGGSTTSRTTRDPFKKRSTSRSGRVVYEGTNNAPSTTRGRVGVAIPSAPRTTGSARATRAVYREDRIIANDPRYNNGHYKSGYHHYDPIWVDHWFYYPHYGFEYRYGHSHPSPFYYYHHMPGYVLYTRIHIGDFHFTILADKHYTWRRPSYRGGYSYSGINRGDRGNSYKYSEVDYAIDDLVRAFERGRVRYLDDILPRDRDVHIALEDYTDYRMDSEDFYDMIADLIEGSDTRRYKIKDVMYERNQVVIYAEHEFRDPWGRNDTKYHTIVLDENRRGFEIAYFKVDRNRPW